MNIAQQRSEYRRLRIELATLGWWQVIRRNRIYRQLSRVEGALADYDELRDRGLA